MGLAQVLALVGDLLLFLQSFMVTLVSRAERLRETALKRVRRQATMLSELSPVRQLWQLPIQIQHLLTDLQALSEVVLQLVINVSPLYNMVSRKHTVFTEPGSGKRQLWSVFNTCGFVPIT